MSLASYRCSTPHTHPSGGATGRPPTILRIAGRDGMSGRSVPKSTRPAPPDQAASPTDAPAEHEPSPKDRRQQVHAHLDPDLVRPTVHRNPPPRHPGPMTPAGRNCAGSMERWFPGPPLGRVHRKLRSLTTPLQTV